MSNYFEPLDASLFADIDERLESFLSTGWIGKVAVVVSTEKGSMNMEVMSLFVQHLNKFFRTIVPKGVTYCATIKDLDWIEDSINLKAEVAQ